MKSFRNLAAFYILVALGLFAIACYLVMTSNIATGAVVTLLLLGFCFVCLGTLTARRYLQEIEKEKANQQQEQQ